ncbi:exonuclease domain-containing protein [Nocardia otitidiscaviarum]|uniref:Exonuclease domain-containing protein n=1 Tax=Nocardia otitidiscaviarum TaxID=1823 RepID=A0A516NMM2_9NOCA|nr:3'-5' exonuclease [Nocardia otitidiscaviarum]MCP9624618.1 exonuclease domain-containing protein [Nocardia otitidiscaviarum]QDP80148.1 exonuclease domain-containing protein [Nocardia otitidiscaviarum]
MNERFLNVVDVEATCWEGDTPPGQPSEIIEIGLCVLDTETRERVAKHSILVRPERSTVSEFCTRLTTLTPEQVATGIPFAEACALLRERFHTDARPWASWGDYDRVQFQRQCGATGVPYPFGARHTNAKLAFSASRDTSRRYGMAGALRLAGIALEGTHHRGGDDAWNIAALVIDMMQRDSWPA